MLLSNSNKPTSIEAENAVRVLLRYIGEDPDRLDLQDTPKRVVKSYQELFSGYSENASDVLTKTCHDVGEFKNLILLKDIYFSSYCEHHLLPIVGIVSVAYIPNKKVVGISKLVRVVEIFSKRLQVQERMTEQIAASIEKYLQPQGVAVVITAKHSCMTLRGVKQENNSMTTTFYSGVFNENSSTKAEFLSLIKG